MFQRGVKVLFGIAIVTAGCGNLSDATTTTSSSSLLGDPFPGIDPELLAEAAEAFSEVEEITDGLGPIFNERGCGNCHTDGAIGGAGLQIERREGRFVAGLFDPLVELGGSLRQLFTVGNFHNPDLPGSSRRSCDPADPTLCCVPLEVEPPVATVSNVGRLTTPTFGLGLVDAMPDAFFDQLAANQPIAIRGVANRVPIALPNPGDPSQSIGALRVGRFGWKAGIPSLLQFSADAYINEMGITTQSCFGGTSVNTFAIESAPNGVPMVDGCDDLAPRQSPSFANQVGLSHAAGAQVDEVVGNCAGQRTEIQDDVFLFAVFMTALAPAPRDLSDPQVIARGQPLFDRAGCGGCHVPTTFVTPVAPPPIDIDGTGAESVQVPANFPFNPYSDFLVHDMGALGDRIGNAGDTEAVTRRMRTAPLWGIRFRFQFLHDGRASDIAAAIQAHDGQGAAARDAFNALSPPKQQSLVRFVLTL